MSDAPAVGIRPEHAGRDALIAWAVVAALVVGLVRINVKLPAIGHLGSALVAVVFIYVPVALAWRRREDLDDYGFHWEPVRRGLVMAAVAIAAVFPVFVLGYFAFYETACGSTLLESLVPRGMCARYGGLDALHVPELSWISPISPSSPAGANVVSAEFAAVQLVVVALPEELFFRGMLLGLLEQRFPPARRVLGGGIGLALVLSSLAFALIHLPKDGDPRALATFFPGLLFGWMRSATGSILAPTLTHAASNILVRVLELAVLR
ncbi:MAG TPA: CPBP family intramembrane glutamic endopeptidase [Kofleriaceae bacterium]|nr:CPBP family intramembrane glutamic endopeptidase [Kofleriaceae bacterium]